MSSTCWKKGQARRVADAVGISEQNFSDILHRRRGVSLKMARRLEGATGVKWQQWVCNRESSHRAFYGKPVRAL